MCVIVLHITDKLWWRNQMETFSTLLTLCGDNPLVTNGFASPHKGQWRGALMFSLICPWTNGWANNRYARELWRHRAHYDVTVMSPDCSGYNPWWLELSALAIELLQSCAKSSILSLKYSHERYKLGSEFLLESRDLDWLTNIFPFLRPADSGNIDSIKCFSGPFVTVAYFIKQCLIPRWISEFQTGEYEAPNHFCFERNLSRNGGVLSQNWNKILRICSERKMHYCYTCMSNVWYIVHHVGMTAAND